jgi:hypothetical protein
VVIAVVATTVVVEVEVSALVVEVAVVGVAEVVIAVVEVVVLADELQDANTNDATSRKLNATQISALFILPPSFLYMNFDNV